MRRRDLPYVLAILLAIFASFLTYLRAPEAEVAGLFAVVFALILGALALGAKGRSREIHEHQA